MLLSMTGHGDGSYQHAGKRAAVEIRTVNNRYFKFVFRAHADNIGALESKAEAVVRESIRRGTVSLTLKIDRQPTADQYRINGAVVRGYLEQLEAILEDRPQSLPIPVSAVLGLPGVALERTISGEGYESEWELFEPALQAALANLELMRCREGQAMQDELASNLTDIDRQLQLIECRAPAVVDNYRHRLTDRISQLLKDHDVAFSSGDVVREVGLFADKCDIAEEAVRLRSHLVQFRDVMESAPSAGRKLDFLVQEMFRETNTIGSKANDGEIARHVVEIKTNIERMREMVQNVE